ncbi:hypothetical protein LTR37_020475 [Vermiconidia calcicola]|uniref:Uncharacterized protein n=1 Tax=Vermiconidia calcicola TaxID=1690605 RepID=A0ACC3MBD8_9PEZI|nr:hypothetical protein LTR37_020475 [Vermiconidia calcicola]
MIKRSGARSLPSTGECVSQLNRCYASSSTAAPSKAAATSPKAHKSPSRLKTSSSRVRFTAEEDQTLISLRTQRKTWPEISRALPNRSANTLWTRWSQYLRPRLLANQTNPDELDDAAQERIVAEPWRRLVGKRFVRNFTPEDDEKIVQLREAGVPWKKIAKDEFPERSLESLKSRLGKINLQRRLAADGKDGQHSAMTTATARDVTRTYTPWTPAEYEKLLHLRDEKGLQWEDIAKEFPDRPYSGVKGKYFGRRPSGGDKQFYTEEEDVKLRRLRAEDLPWARIADAFPGRTIGSLQKRAYMLLDWDERARKGP